MYGSQGILAANGGPDQPSTAISALGEADAADRIQPGGLHHESKVPSTDLVWPQPLSIHDGHGHGHDYGRERSSIREYSLIPSWANAENSRELPRMEKQEQHPYSIERRLAELDAFFGADETWATHHVRSVDEEPVELQGLLVARARPSTNDADYSVTNDPHSYASAYIELVDKLNQLPASPGSRIGRGSGIAKAHSTEKDGNDKDGNILSEHTEETSHNELTSAIVDDARFTYATIPVDAGTEASMELPETEERGTAAQEHNESMALENNAKKVREGIERSPEVELQKEVGKTGSNEKRRRIEAKKEMGADDDEEANHEAD